MSRKTIRRDAFGGDERDQEPAAERPATGRKRERAPNLNEALATVVLTVGARLVEEWLRGPTPRPRPVSVFEGEPLTVLRTCTGNPATRDKCGTRYVEATWNVCPYCGDTFAQVKQ